MSQILGKELPERAMSYLQMGRLVVMATVDERGWPDTCPISWIVALDSTTLRLAISREVSTYRNLLQNESVMISLIGGAMTLGIRGRARLLSEDMDNIPLPMAMVEVRIDEVKDDSVIGRGLEGELIKWEERRRTVSDLHVENALRNTDVLPRLNPLEDQLLP
jgi:hypothetical protein